MNLLKSTLAHHEKVLQILALAVENGGAFTSAQFDSQFPSALLLPEQPLERILGVKIPRFFGPGLSGDALFLGSDSPHLELLIAMVHCGILVATPNDPENPDDNTYSLPARQSSQSSQ